MREEEDITISDNWRAEPLVAGVGETINPKIFCVSVAVNGIWGSWEREVELQSRYLLMAMAMMTGSQPEYSSSLVDGIFLAISTHRGHMATNTEHTSGLAKSLYSVWG